MFVFGAMCLLTLFSIVAAVKNNIFRDGFICLVNIVNISSLVFLTLLSGFLLAKTEEYNGQRCWFLLFLINVYAAAFFSAMVNVIYQTPNHVRQITVLGTAGYFFAMLVFLTLWLYQKQYHEESNVTRVITGLIFAAVFVYTVLLIVNLFYPFIFQVTEQGVYSESVTDYISIITAAFCLILSCIGTFSSRLSRSSKFSFLCCVFSPTLFAVLSVNQDILNWGIYIWGIMSISIVLPLCLMFFNAHDELENDVLRYEREQIRLQVSAMISQMQPHFLYNSLATISALCEEDPKLAAEATNAFADYLRENMNFADKRSPITFSEELNHIKTYAWLEKLRFSNKLNIEYDINCTAFYVPALSVQPMVENAIKHGICKAESGGTVRICSFETDQYYCVTVSDDGIGFDVQKEPDDGRRHLGIANTRYRIREMMGGSLDIESTPGKGTIVTIKIPKNKISSDYPSCE